MIYFKNVYTIIILISCRVTCGSGLAVVSESMMVELARDAEGALKGVRRTKAAEDLRPRATEDIIFCFGAVESNQKRQREYTVYNCFA